mmetsp:Transcript_24/g.63  ORF Transcript_24/g.63 Transcript_24/m.63 type:complete len:217 (-) Transcript_24:205-855(-)
MQFAYLHGFASSPKSKKGVELAKRFAAGGHTLQLPDLNYPSFAEITYSNALSVIVKMDAESLLTQSSKAPWCLIGSSMGGFLAARFAQLYPERVSRLVLLCPAFDLISRWPKVIGKERFNKWRTDGFLDYVDFTGQVTKIKSDFLLDAEKHPTFPDVSCPTLVIHGDKDTVVPIEFSREFCSRNPAASLIEVPDDHELLQHVDLITDEAFRFFGIS